MRIAVDGFNIGMPEGTGIARYGRNLIANLSEDGHEVGVLYGADCRPKPDGSIDRSAIMKSLSQGEPRQSKGQILADLMLRGRQLKADVLHNTDQLYDDILFPQGSHCIWNIRRLYRRSIRYFRTTGKFYKIKIPNVDLVHWTSVLPITAIGVKNIYTIHDMIPVKMPHLVSGGGEYYHNICKKISQQADAIVTVSEISRDDIVEVVGDKGAPIYNTYLDVSRNITKSKSFKDSGKSELFAEFFQSIYKKYFLFYGAWEPKKNLRRIIEGYLLSGTDCPLVICGGDGWDNHEEKAFLASIESNMILRVPYVSDDVLGMIIRNARATLFPSLYEGFGLPLVESMALGTAVISSTTGSIPEIAGGAALLVDPYEIDEIAKAIRAVDSDVELRLTLEQQGLKRAEKFSSVGYMQRLNNIYREVLSL